MTSAPLSSILHLYQFPETFQIFLYRVINFYTAFLASYLRLLARRATSPLHTKYCTSLRLVTTLSTQTHWALLFSIQFGDCELCLPTYLSLVVSQTTVLTVTTQLLIPEGTARHSPCQCRETVAMHSNRSVSRIDHVQWGSHNIGICSWSGLIITIDLTLRK